MKVCQDGRLIDKYIVRATEVAACGVDGSSRDLGRNTSRRRRKEGKGAGGQGGSKIGPCWTRRAFVGREIVLVASDTSVVAVGSDGIAECDHKGSADGCRYRCDFRLKCGRQKKEKVRVFTLSKIREEHEGSAYTGRSEHSALEYRNNFELMLSAPSWLPENERSLVGTPCAQQ